MFLIYLFHISKQDLNVFFVDSKTKTRPAASYQSKRRRPSNGGDGTGDGKERVPFLVPLMMVPETDVGVEKPFSFAQEQAGVGGNGLGNVKYHICLQLVLLIIHAKILP